MNKHIVNRIIKLGIAHVFLRVWKSISKVAYLHVENIIAFKNYQTALSVIWNCTDKSGELGESLAKCGVIQLFISELGTDKLKLSDLKHENYLYLVKAYLGILHNIVRLCSDSRRLFRSANAVSVLQGYIASSIELVKTKAFLVLSYIITEAENNVINATDENIQFIVDILQDALNSENHFSQRYAFWASEILCGLNHLAVNDSNKARLGRVGALPLYLRSLQSNSNEEQNLSAAGLWILAFKDENKQLIKQDPKCMEGMREKSMFWRQV